MPGREDFAIVRARLLADDRAHRAAQAYVEAGIALDATALGAVVGHVAPLGLYTSRETDDGVLPGDGVTPVAVATMTTRTVAQAIVRALLVAGLLREHDRGVYVVGFAGCYGPILEKRRADAERKARARSGGRPADWAGVSGGRPPDNGRTSSGKPAPSERTVRTVRTEGSPPPPAGGGRDSASPEDAAAPAGACPVDPRGRGAPPPSRGMTPPRADGDPRPDAPRPSTGVPRPLPEPERAAPVRERADVDVDVDLPLSPRGGGSEAAAPLERRRKPLRRRERERFGRVLDYVVRCGTQGEIAAALELRRRHVRGDVPDAEIERLLAGTFRHVTPEKLARWKDEARPARQKAPVPIDDPTPDPADEDVGEFIDEPAVGAGIDLHPKLNGGPHA